MTLTEIETVGQMRANYDPDAPPPPSAPLAEATALAHAMLDKNYRATLDKPVSMLGDLTRHAAAWTAAGRMWIVTW